MKPRHWRGFRFILPHDFGLGLSSPFHLINCLIPPHPSVAAYVVGSGIYIGVEIDAALEYEELLNRINKLVKGGQNRSRSR